MPDSLREGKGKKETENREEIVRKKISSRICVAA